MSGCSECRARLQTIRELSPKVAPKKADGFVETLRRSLNTRHGVYCLHPETTRNKPNRLRDESKREAGVVYWDSGKLKRAANNHQLTGVDNAKLNLRYLRQDYGADDRKLILATPHKPHHYKAAAGDRRSSREVVYRIPSRRVRVFHANNSLLPKKHQTSPDFHRSK